MEWKDWAKGGVPVYILHCSGIVFCFRRQQVGTEAKKAPKRSKNIKTGGIFNKKCPFLVVFGQI